jgi:hypothetical protein
MTQKDQEMGSIADGNLEGYFGMEWTTNFNLQNNT